MSPDSTWFRIAACLSWLAVSWLLAAPSSGQEETGSVASFTEAVEVRVVNVETFVTDRAGRPVPGLTRDDFELRVDGKKVAISNFYREGAPDSGDPGGELAAVTSPPEGDAVAPTPGARASEHPLYLMVAIDNSRLRASNRKRALSAARGVLSHRLSSDAGASTQVAIVSLTDTLSFDAGFSGDLETLDEVLGRIGRRSVASQVQGFERRQVIAELNRGMSGGIVARGAHQSADSGQLLMRIRANAADEYHRALQSLRQLERLVATVAGLPGRKAILYVSDGIPNRPGEELFVEWVNRFGGDNPEAGIGLRRVDVNTDYHRAVGNYDLLQNVEALAAAANGAGVTLYALDAENDHGADLRSALTEQGAISLTLTVATENYRELLEVAASETGGRRIQASGLLDEHLESLANDFDAFYSLGFSPPAWAPGTRHSIKVTLPGRNKLTVRHRQAVLVTGGDDQAARATVAALLYDGADFTASAGNPLGVTLEPGVPAKRSDGTVLLGVLVAIPADAVALLPSGDVFSTRLTFFVSVENQVGNPGTVQKIPFHLEVPAENLSATAGQPLHTTLPVVLRTGDRQLAVSVREEASGVVSTVRADVSRYTGEP